MKKPSNLKILTGLLFLFIISLTIQAFAQVDKAAIVLNQVYGSISTACSQDTDLDTAVANRVTLTAGRRYVIYCHSGAGAGVACECLQGSSTVDASAAVGIQLFAGEKMIVSVQSGRNYISCVPFADNQVMDACPLD